MKIENIITDGFIFSIGIESEFTFFEIANNNSTYKIWIDATWECELKNNYRNKGLEPDEIDLLVLNKLRNLTIVKAHLNSKDDLRITFENSVILTIAGNNSDSNCFEPWRIYQITPETTPIYIANNK